MGFITANRQQLDLLGYSIDDFVGKGSRSRQVAAIVDRLDLSEVYADYSEQGGDAFDPAMALSVWFLAYCEGVSSSRKVEELCRRDLHYIYLTANLRPDHCALSRFRQRHVERLPKLFVQVVRLAKEQGLAGFERLSVDGSKVEAASSSRKNRKGKELELELARLRSDIEAYLRECEEEEEEPDAGKLEKLKNQQAHLEDCQRTLELRKEALEPKDRGKHAVNLTEPEARSMANVNGQIAAPAYNAQIAVDEQSQMIASCSLSDEPNDRQQFSKVHEATERNLGGEPKRQYTVDSGYHSFEQLEYVKQRGVDALMAEPRPKSRQPTADDGGKFGRGNFRYDAGNDCYVCPAGRILPYWTQERRRGRQLTLYRSRNCSGCALRWRCLGRPENPKSFRRIVRDSQEQLAEEMFARAQSKEGQKRLKRRAQSVEPVFGNIKHNIGFRRFCLRGIKKAAGEFALMCIAHNLRKWIQQSGKKASSDALSAQMLLNRALRVLLRVICPHMLAQRTCPA